MFEKNKKIKLIGTILVLAVIIGFVITNIRIQSVNTYKQNQESLAAEQAALSEDQNSSNSDQDLASADGSNQDEQNSSDFESASSENADSGSETDTNSDGTSSLDNSSDTDATSGTDGSGSGSDVSNSTSDSDSSGNGSIITGSSDTGSSNSSGSSGSDSSSNSSGSSGSSSSSDSSSGSSSSESSDSSTSEDIISCTIEIRCDSATARKSSLTNESVSSLIPDDGTILSTTTYSNTAGFSVYDVLIAVTQMNGIATVSNSSKTYVSSINNLSEKMLGTGSGWTYRVNGSLVMTSSNKCIVNNNDTIQWIYVCSSTD